MKALGSSWKTMAAEARKWLSERLADEKKRVNLLLCVGVAGLLLIALSEWFPLKMKTESAQSAPATDSTANQQDYAQQLEQRLEEVIAQMDGVGRVEVMVTLRQGQEAIYATDQETSSQGETSVHHVLVSDDGLIETFQMPQVLGVAVVCEGGDTAAVQNRISSLVESLTGVGANHITVAKMASTQ